MSNWKIRTNLPSPRLLLPSGMFPRRPTRIASELATRSKARDIAPQSRRELWRSVDRRRESFGVVQPRESDGKGLQMLFNNFNSSFQFADLVHKFMKKIAQRHGNVSSEFSISALR